MIGFDASSFLLRVLLAAPWLAATAGTTATAPLPEGAPLKVLDLAVADDVRALGGEWRYSDVRIVSTPFYEADANGQPSRVANTAYDIEPRAGARDFDDSRWAVLAPEALSQRRSAGKVSFNWYRIELTIPEKIGTFDPSGSTVVLDLSIDDYAEIWVDGELPRRFPQSGGSVVAGWNVPNRLVIGRNVQPGETIQLALFGINGPISQAPTNYIYIRHVRLEFHRGGWQPIAVEPQEVNVEVNREDAAIDAIVPTNPKLFKLAEGFTFTEGPVWSGDSLWFSDPNENRIYRYRADGRLTIARERSGYAGADIARYHQPGSNGLTLDAQGRLTLCEHGNRRVTRTEADGSIRVLADGYQGKRLNSPNDLVYKSDGALYFTDPPFGLPAVYEDPAKELAFSGVYRVKDGEISLLTDELDGPNGIAFSPDERFLYVGNWDLERILVMRYPVRDDGLLGPGEVFYDMTTEGVEEAIDGIKVDRAGNLYVSGASAGWAASRHHRRPAPGPQLRLGRPGRQNAVHDGTRFAIPHATAHRGRATLKAPLPLRSLALRLFRIGVPGVGKRPRFSGGHRRHHDQEWEAV